MANNKYYDKVVVQGDKVTPIDSNVPISSIGQAQIKGDAGNAGNANPITGNQGQQAAQNQQQAPQQGGQSAAGALINMPGVSDATKQTLGQLAANGYQPSHNVNAAMQELNSIIAKQPGAFQSQYSAQLNNLLNQILNRGPFAYDMASDPMYQMYRQQYVQQGKQAMEDTIGRAAQLTGGYGSSYATTAAQQAYQGQLNQMQNIIPQLYQQARQAYNDEGDLLMSQYGAVGDAYNREYGEYQDQYDKWLAERDYAQNQYTDERNFDYGSYSDQLNLWSGLAGMEQDQANADRDFQMKQDAMAQDQAYQDKAYALELALAMAEAGKTPSAELLMQAGFNQEDIDIILKGKSSSGSSGGGSSGSKGSSGSGNEKTYVDTTSPKANADKQAAYSHTQEEKDMLAEMTPAERLAYLKEKYKDENGKSIVSTNIYPQTSYNSLGLK